MSLYATLADFRTENKAQATSDDPVGLFNLRIVSQRIDTLFASRRPVFMPYIETRKVRITSDRVNSRDNTLRLDGSLLALTTTVLGTTTLTDAVGWPDADMPPFPYLRRTGDCAHSWYTDCGTCGSPLFATITGIWGLHRNYAEAWQKVDDLAADINASAVSLAVADVDGADVYGIIPRISAGNLLRIDSEFLEVIATNTGTNAVTVRRGVNGSTAAAHVAGADVYVWQVEEPIRRVTARQAALLYARRGAYELVSGDGMGAEIRYPQDLLNELRATVGEYSYV